MPIILDNSVILKWFLTHETDSNYALQILSDVLDSEIFLIEPSLLIYEFNNVVNMLTQGGKLRSKDGLNVLEKFQSISEELITFDTLQYGQNEVFKLGEKHLISSYDASYLYLAIQNNAILYTADQKLINKTKQEQTYIKSFLEYNFSK